MNNDRLLKKPELLPILKIGRNKLYDIINSGEFIKPVVLPNVKVDLYSYNELMEWLEEKKSKRSENKPPLQMVGKLNCKES